HQAQPRGYLKAHRTILDPVQPAHPRGLLPLRRRSPRNRSSCMDAVLRARLPGWENLPCTVRAVQRGPDVCIGRSKQQSLEGLELCGAADWDLQARPSTALRVAVNAAEGIRETRR